MDYNRLGQTELEVSVLGFGTGPLGELFGPVDETQAQSIVRKAIDEGINLFDTSPYYGNAEERLGKAIRGYRDNLVIATKVGRYGFDDFDYSPSRIRRSVEASLRLLQTDYVDIILLHDIEYVELDGPLTDGYAELLRLRDSGACRYIGVSGYPLAAMKRAMNDVQLDVLLTYAHGTLLDDSIRTELLPLAGERGVGLINAAAVALGLLTHDFRRVRRDLLPDGTSIQVDHPATPEIQAAAKSMAEICAEAGKDISELANQYALQRSGCATTLVGTAKAGHLDAAIKAANTPIDDALLASVVALRPSNRCWSTGLLANN